MGDTSYSSLAYYEEAIGRKARIAIENYALYVFFSFAYALTGRSFTSVRQSSFWLLPLAVIARRWNEEKRRDS